MSENYFDLLGVKAARGRTFQHDDEGALIVSRGFWQKRFGGDPALVGKIIFLNNNSFTVIGIAPESFTGIDLGRSTEIFVPMRMQPDYPQSLRFCIHRLHRLFL